MPTDYQRGYSRGYYAGSSGKWPDHRPPVPPDGLVGELVRAMQALRDGVDSELATLPEDDPWQEKLGPLVDRADEALKAVGLWLREGEDG